MRHHAGLMVFEDMAMVHPSPGTIVLDPCNLHRASWFKIISILPCFVFGRLAVLFQHLEKETVKVKRMIHQATIPDLPYLPLANIDRRIGSVDIAINKRG